MKNKQVKKKPKLKYWLCEDGHYSGICLSEKRPWLSHQDHGYETFDLAKASLVEFFKLRVDNWKFYYKKAQKLRKKNVVKI